MFITHDFDEALKLADRIAIMKDGIIEQLDTPANIVLNPATEYVKKFTEEVPREKVLKIEDVMDKPNNENLGDLKVSKNAIIEDVAEKILTQEKLQKTIMFITHDFDEALKLADRIAIMKDGIIEQLDTPANIVLNPATEYVRKFTEEVPREKVLKIKDIMEKPQNVILSDLKVLKN